jgi:hypothetical protein
MRRFFRRMAVIVGAVLALSQAAAAVPATTYKESFEQDLGGWQPASDGLPRSWQVYRTTKFAADGRVGLGFDVNGLDDDGTVWIQHAYQARPNTRVRVVLSFLLYTVDGTPTNSWKVVGSLGTRAPRVEGDFKFLGYADHSGVWRRYTVTGEVTTDGSGTVWVAAGVSVLWETNRIHYVDAVETTIN